MNLYNLFKLAALGLVVILAACGNEELLSGGPDGKVDLKDGEIAVKMNIGGLGGSVVTRAANDVLLPGETSMGKIDVYSFVNLSKGNPSSEAYNPEDYTLERVYKYVTQGNANDLFLTPLGNGYQVTFGVLKDDFKRIFVLVANDGATRAVTATSLSTAGVGGDRSQATTWHELQTLPTLATNLPTGSVVVPPLLMQGVAGRLKNGVSDPVYSKDDLNNNISVVLKRAVARIDIKNAASTRFNITKVQFMGGGNSNLFAGYGNIQVPVADKNGDTNLVAYEELTTNFVGEWLLGAFYGYPVKTGGDADDHPTLVITGNFGGGTGDIEVRARFDGIAPNPNGMQPNTRYVVNLLNSANNVIANITVAEWEKGESLDTEDVVKALNASATLTPYTASTTSNVQFEGRTLYFYNAGGDPSLTERNQIATIEGAPGDDKPIGILLPNDSYLQIVDLGTGANGARKYTLHASRMSGHTDRLLEGTFSLLTYDPVSKKQVIDEYSYIRDNVLITDYTTPSDQIFLPVSFNYDLQPPGLDSYRVPPFGASNACTYGMMTSGAGQGCHVVIPASCLWISDTRMGEAGSETAFFLSIDNNIGGDERSVVLKTRWYDEYSSSPFKIESRDITIIQEQGKSIDPIMLADSYKLLLSKYAVDNNEIKIEDKTITVSADTYPQLEIINDFPESEQHYVSFDSPDYWIHGEGEYKYSQIYRPIRYITKVDILPLRNTQGTFTVTTCRSGAFVTDTYTVKVVDGPVNP